MWPNARFSELTSAKGLPLDRIHSSVSRWVWFGPNRALPDCSWLGTGRFCWAGTVLRSTLCAGLPGGAGRDEFERLDMGWVMPASSSAAEQLLDTFNLPGQRDSLAGRAVELGWRRAGCQQWERRLPHGARCARSQGAPRRATPAPWAQVGS